MGPGTGVIPLMDGVKAPDPRRDPVCGDGKADLAVRRPWDQTWYVLKSSNPDTPAVLIWGNAGDQVPQ